MNALTRNRLVSWFLFLFTSLIAIIVCIEWIDVPLSRFFLQYKDTPLTYVARGLTKTGEAQYYLIPALVLAALFWKRRRHLANKALYLFSVIAIGGIAVTVLKMLFGRTRPKMFFNEHLYSFTLLDYRNEYLSFPSGHTTVFFTVWMGLAVLFPRWRMQAFLVASVFSFTRVILGAHYLSDVIAGAVLGTATCYLVAYQWNRSAHAVPVPVPAVAPPSLSA